MNTPQISIIIVTWNSAAYIVPCLESIFSKVVGCQYELVIADNQSGDDTIITLQSFLQTSRAQAIIPCRCLQIRLIQLHTNVGFGAANNVAAALSRANDLVFLNPDTVLLSDLSLLVNHQLPHPGLIGALLLNENEKPTITQGSLPGFGQIVKQLLLFSEYRANIGIDQTDPYPVGFPSCACLCVSRHLFQKAEGFNATNFLYYEEAELTARIAKANPLAGNWVLPLVKVLHLEGRSTNQVPQKHFDFYYTALFLFLRNHAHPMYHFFYWLLLLLTKIEKVTIYLLLAIITAKRQPKLITHLKAGKALLTIPFKPNAPIPLNPTYQQKWNDSWQ